MIEPDLFSFRLRHVREERGMSQRALAAGICSPSAISRWESGESVPSLEIVIKLANRLGLSVEVLTSRDFNSRLLVSGEDFGGLLNTTFDDNQIASAGSAMATWISRARCILKQADPWITGPSPRQIVDDLAVDPLTASSPVSLETVELLDAMVCVREAQDQSSVSVLTETLTWTKHAPQAIRTKATETVVALLLSSEMPIAAHDALTRINPHQITATSAILLTWDAALVQELPPIAATRSSRDIAFGVLSSIRNMANQERQQIAEIIIRTCSDDGLVRQWATSLYALRSS